MNKLIIFLCLFCFSYNSYSQSCNAGTGFEVFALHQRGEADKAKALMDKCKVVKAVSVKPIPKDNSKCDACWNKHGKGVIGRGVCGNSMGCSLPGFFASVEYATIIAPCANEMFCSEDTQMCEYICDNGFEYNFYSGQCEMYCGDNQIVQNNQCVSCQGEKIPNEARTQCICPVGKVEENGECVLAENPCEELGPDYRPYQGQNPLCKIPTSKESYFGPCMGTSCYRATYSFSDFNPQTTFNVSAQHVGCEKVGNQNHAVFRINNTRSDHRFYKHQAYSMPIYAVCADANLSGTQYPAHKGNFPTYMSDTNNYIKVPAANSGNATCYKYRLIIQDAYTIYDIGDFDLPYETCQDCPTGTVKINGQCSCPSGFIMGQNGSCIDEANCGTAANFNAGNCQCSTPYGYPSVNGYKYSCSNQPTYSRFQDYGSISRQSTTSVSASVTSCSGGVATISWSASNSGNYSVSMSAICMDPSYLERYPDPQPGEYSFYGFGGAPATTVSGNSSGSGTFNLSVDGSCYNYKMVAIDTWSWMGEADFSLSYSCLQGQ